MSLIAPMERVLLCIVWGKSWGSYALDGARVRDVERVGSFGAGGAPVEVGGRGEAELLHGGSVQGLQGHARHTSMGQRRTMTRTTH
eukprot:3576773-Rhodomonas_salina.1